MKHNFIIRWLSSFRNWALTASSWYIFILDMIFSSLMTWVSFRFFHFIHQGTWVAEHLTYVYLIDLPITALVYWRAGIYKTFVRYTTLRDLRRLMFAVFIANLLLAGIVIRLWPNLARFHMASFLFNFLLTTFVLIILRIVCIGGRRWLDQMFSNLSVQDLTREGRKKVMLVGNIDIIAHKAKLIQSQKYGKYKVVGFLTMTSVFEGKTLDNLPVYVATNEDDLAVILEKVEIDALVFVGKEGLQDAKKLAHYCLENGIQLLASPDKLQELGQHPDRNIDNVQIEDLLEREEIQIDTTKIFSDIKGKVVMVTGAAGSIGSELVRQLALFSPRLIVMLDHAETPLWMLRMEMERVHPHVPISCALTSVRDLEKVEWNMNKYRPDLVFHAAAYKHVPLMEEKPCTAVLNNVEGTINMAKSAARHKVGRFVLVSSDKAVNPSSVMGASKRLCEIFVQCLDAHLRKTEGEGETTFVVTRFGNVLGSSGSVVPLFKEQIKNGGPVTVTHKDIIRYFMTIPEACRLILQANSMGKGGEIFVFDMGDPVKIADLAKRMIYLAGLIPGKDIIITYTGLRPGEKLYEELLTDFEQTLETVHKRIRISQAMKYEMSHMGILFDNLIKHANASDKQETVRYMKLIVPEYESKNSPYQVFNHYEPGAE